MIIERHLHSLRRVSSHRFYLMRTLLTSLQMPTIRDLEDLIIDAIYLDVIRGKLDQKEQQFEVEYTMGRDLAPGKVESVLAALQAW
jgi:COP9 signalosome complex subunit 7